MGRYNYGWTVVQCNPDERGADAVLGAMEFFLTEAEALAFLANVRDDDPTTGNGWTTLCVRVWNPNEVAA
jgi:hypothetical protein